MQLWELLILEHTPLTEAKSAAEQAHDLGLHHVGWGYWADDSDKKVARTINGQLVKLTDGEADGIPDDGSDDVFGNELAHDGENSLGILTQQALKHVGLAFGYTDEVRKLIAYAVLTGYVKQEAGVYSTMDADEVDELKNFLNYVATSKNSKLVTAVAIAEKQRFAKEKAAKEKEKAVWEKQKAELEAAKQAELEKEKAAAQAAMTPEPTHPEMQGSLAPATVVSMLGLDKSLLQNDQFIGLIQKLDKAKSGAAVNYIAQLLKGQHSQIKTPQFITQEQWKQLHKYLKDLKGGIKVGAANPGKKKAKLKGKPEDTKDGNYYKKWIDGIHPNHKQKLEGIWDNFLQAANITDGIKGVGGIIGQGEILHASLKALVDNDYTDVNNLANGPLSAEQVEVLIGAIDPSYKELEAAPEEKPDTSWWMNLPDEEVSKINTAFYNAFPNDIDSLSLKDKNEVYLRIKQSLDAKMYSALWDLGPGYGNLNILTDDEVLALRKAVADIVVDMEAKEQQTRSVADEQESWLPTGWDELEPHIKDAVELGWSHIQAEHWEQYGTDIQLDDNQKKDIFNTLTIAYNAVNDGTTESILTNNLIGYVQVETLNGLTALFGKKKVEYEDKLMAESPEEMGVMMKALANSNSPFKISDFSKEEIGNISMHIQKAIIANSDSEAYEEIKNAIFASGHSSKSLALSLSKLVNELRADMKKTSTHASSIGDESDELNADELLSHMFGKGYATLPSLALVNNKVFHAYNTGDMSGLSDEIAELVNSGIFSKTTGQELYDAVEQYVKEKSDGMNPATMPQADGEDLVSAKNLLSNIGGFWNIPSPAEYDELASDIANAGKAGNLGQLNGTLDQFLKNGYISQEERDDIIDAVLTKHPELWNQPSNVISTPKVKDILQGVQQIQNLPASAQFKLVKGIEQSLADGNTSEVESAVKSLQNSNLIFDFEADAVIKNVKDALSPQTGGTQSGGAADILSGYEHLPSDVFNSIQQEVGKALQTGSTLDVQELLADLKVDGKVNIDMAKDIVTKLKDSIAKNPPTALIANNIMGLSIIDYDNFPDDVDNAIKGLVSSALESGDTQQLETELVSFKTANYLAGSEVSAILNSVKEKIGEKTAQATGNPLAAVDIPQSAVNGVQKSLNGWAKGDPQKILPWIIKKVNEDPKKTVNLKWQAMELVKNHGISLADVPDEVVPFEMQEVVAKAKAGTQPEESTATAASNLNIPQEKVEEGADKYLAQFEKAEDALKPIQNMIADLKASKSANTPQAQASIALFTAIEAHIQKKVAEEKATQQNPVTPSKSNLQLKTDETKLKAFLKKNKGDMDKAIAQADANGKLAKWKKLKQYWKDVVSDIKAMKADMDASMKAADEQEAKEQELTKAELKSNAEGMVKSTLLISGLFFDKLDKSVQDKLLKAVEESLDSHTEFGVHLKFKPLVTDISEEVLDLLKDKVLQALEKEGNLDKTPGAFKKYFDYDELFEKMHKGEFSNKGGMEQSTPEQKKKFSEFLQNLSPDDAVTIRQAMEAGLQFDGPDGGKKAQEYYKTHLVGKIAGFDDDVYAVWRRALRGFHDELKEAEQYEQNKKAAAEQKKKEAEELKKAAEELQKALASIHSGDKAATIQAIGSAAGINTMTPDNQKKVLLGISAALNAKTSTDAMKQIYKLTGQNEFGGYTYHGNAPLSSDKAKGQKLRKLVAAAWAEGQDTYEPKHPEPKVAEPVNIRVKRVLNAWEDEHQTSAGYVSSANEERSSLITALTSALSEPDPAKVNSHLNSLLLTTTSLSDAQVSQLRKLVQRERQTPGSLAGKQIKQFKFTSTSGKPKVFNKQGAEWISHAIPTPSAKDDANARKFLESLPASYDHVKKEFVEGEFVKHHPSVGWGGLNWNAVGANHDYEADTDANTQDKWRQTNLPKEVFKTFTAAADSWQGGGQWSKPAEVRKTIVDVMHTVIEGPPPHYANIGSSKFLERGMFIDNADFEEFIKAFKIGDPVYFGPSGFSANRSTASSFGGGNSFYPTHTKVLMRVRPPKSGKIKGAWVMNRDHGGSSFAQEQEIVLGTSKGFRCVAVTKHVVTDANGQHSLAYEIEMQYDEDALNESVIPKSTTGYQTQHWKGLSRDTVKMLLKWVGTSLKDIPAVKK